MLCKLLLIFELMPLLAYILSHTVRQLPSQFSDLLSYVFLT